jgi:hypothetical protein
LSLANAVVYTNGSANAQTTTSLRYDGSTLNVTGAIVATGDITAFSDERLKTDVITIDDALTKLNQINGYLYTNSTTGKRHTGVIAQEIIKVLPEAVMKNNNDYYSVAYGNLIGLLIQGIKELNTEVNSLKKKLQ